MIVYLFQFFVYLFLFVVFVGSVYGGDFCMDYVFLGVVDGCSVFFFYFDYEVQFMFFCNKYDVCYDCVRILFQYFVKLIYLRFEYCNVIVNC